MIPNAIDAGRLEVGDPAATRRSVRERLRLGPEDRVALFVGHNYRLKGLGPLLEALALRDRRDGGRRPITLVACGGPKTGAFRRLARSLGLEGRVRLLGFLPDVRDAYHTADLFVLPTYYDPCSLVVLEALACGLPVITTAYNGASELITPGREGFVVPSPDDLDGLAEALDRLGDDATRRVMSAHAARLGRTQGLGRHVDRLIELLVEVAASRRAANASTIRGPHAQEAATLILPAVG